MPTLEEMRGRRDAMLAALAAKDIWGFEAVIRDLSEDDLRRLWVLIVSKGLRPGDADRHKDAIAAQIRARKGGA